MYLIQEVLVSAEVFSQKFVCHLDKCKGACCWEGDFGAPVSESEKEIIADILPRITPYLSSECQDRIADLGPTGYDSGYGGEVTTLMPDGSCAFLIREGGIAQCAFERAHSEGKTSWQKPISCHLYPIRVTSNEETGFEAMNYSEWDICSDACSLGEELNVPVYQFAKSAIIRKYGEAFYEEMDALYRDYINA